MYLFFVSKCRIMACSCAKSQIGCSELCNCEGDSWNIWKICGNIENDDEYSDEEEYESEDEDGVDNLLE